MYEVQKPEAEPSLLCKIMLRSALDAYSLFMMDFIGKFKGHQYVTDMFMIILGANHYILKKLMK